MRIDETRVFLFTFKTDQGDVQFPIRAENREQAGNTMQKALQRMQAELAMDFPKTEPIEVVTPEPALNIPTVIPPEVLELRINTLLGDMGAGTLTGKAKSDTIKLWTGFDFNEANYTSIITELELIRTGQKEIPVKKK